MFKIIKNCISTLYRKCSTAKTVQSNYIGAIAFKLTEANEIDILYSLPSTEDKTSDQILNNAEQYAKFLMLINQGYLQEDIIKIFQKNIKPDDQPNDHLLLDNILVFWGMAEIEEVKRLNKQIKKQQPLVRPSVVFSRSSD